MKKLVIVESPAKAGTIKKILGKDYTIKSSFGHVRDLAKDGKKNTGIEVDNDYKPHYEIPTEKKKVVAELRKAQKKHKKVLLATDEDREGEAISWHLHEVLKLNKKNSERISFTEITPTAVKKAVENPRELNTDLVNAQQARRILDRLVGFELTSLLWKKVRGQLSAGRVQSVAVRLIVDKERDIQDFKPKSYYRVTGEFMPEKGKKNDSLEAKLSKRINSKKKAKEFLEKCKKATYTASAVEKKPAKRKPNAPFTTSTLQQLASRKLGFSVSRTMRTAQKLYEAGHITYMRTDSIVISNSALKSIADHVKKEYGDKYSQVRKFKNKSKSSQEAHEAIRPTYINKKDVGANRDQKKLYHLIRSRTLASQMADAEVERTTITIDISTIKDKHFQAKGEIVTFDGFLRAYSGTKWYSADDTLLPDIKKGSKLDKKWIQALERHTKPPARYSEATLVKKLEELGIGRPSTYAPTIAKITSPSRGYVKKESRDGEEIEYTLFKLTNSTLKEETQTENAGAQKNKLFGTDIGMLVTDFLMENFAEIMDYEFTAEVENKLDEIASGKEEWTDVLDKYYKPFTKEVKKALDAERVTGERILGKDPDSGKTLLVRMSKYGPVAQIGAPDELKDDESPEYANLMPKQSIEDITFDEALKLFELPKKIASYKKKDIIVGRGRYGPYLKYDDSYVSIKGTNPFQITKKEAVEKIKEKLKEMEPIAEYKDKPITKGKGRFGPYVKWQNTFASITKKSGYTLETIDEKGAKKLIKEKLKKDEEKTIKKWADGKIKLMKGRWGPVFKIKGKRKVRGLPKDENGKKMDPEVLQKMSKEEIMKILKLKKI